MADELPLVDGDQPIPNPADDPDAMDPLVIRDETGQVIFAIRANGVVEMPDPTQAEKAAAIFWREVLAVADLLGIEVVTP